MNTDNLDTLNDAQLSEVFAVEYLGWAIHSRNTACWVDAAERDGMMERVHAFVGELNFATSADAVLPFLEAAVKHGAPHAECSFMDGTWRVDLHWTVAPYICARAKTLARAICCVLILAKRAENGGAK